MMGKITINGGEYNQGNLMKMDKPYLVSQCLGLKKRIEILEQSLETGQVDAVVMVLNDLMGCKDEDEFDSYATDISQEFVDDLNKTTITDEMREFEGYPDDWTFSITGKDLEKWDEFVNKVQLLRGVMFPESEDHDICWAIETP